MRASTASIAWFTVQALLAGSWIAVLLFPHGGFSLSVRAFGGVIVVLGIVLLIASYRVLGGNHSPWSEPVAGGSIVTRGPYAWVRHPIYVGYVVTGFGGALAAASPIGVLIAGACLLYYDLRSRFEERELAKVHHDFEQYRRSVRGRFIPGLY